MDRRQKKTRSAIYNAFTDLLKEEAYSKITVQQIIDRAAGRASHMHDFGRRNKQISPAQKLCPPSKITVFEVRKMVLIKKTCLLKHTHPVYGRPCTC